MKKVVFIPLILFSVLIAMLFFFLSRPGPEQAFRTNLTEAQKMLGTLRRAEAVHYRSTQSYQQASAKISDGNMRYSDGWRALKLPGVEPNAGFDYECVPEGVFCRAMESGSAGPSGNGIQIDLKAGAFSCLGSYKNVTTEGFDGASVVVGCEA